MSAFHPYNQQPKRHFRKKTLSTRLKIGNFSLSIVLIILMCLLSIAQVMHSNNIQTKGYEIRELEQKKQELTIVNKALKMTVTEAQSLVAIKDSPVVSNMQIIVDPIVVSTDNAVAVK